MTEEINIHEDEDQQLRQRNARFCKIVSVDSENKVGLFKGSAKTPYTTTPEKCTCRDFILRGLPCKHMYRLMHELGAFDLNTTREGRVSEFGYDRSGFNPSQIERLSEPAQRELFGLVRQWAGSSYSEWIYNRNNPLIEELISSEFLEEFNSPRLLLLILPIQKLREFVKDNKDIDKRKKEPIIDEIIKSRLDVINIQKESYIPVRFREMHRPLRGQIRTYLRNKFPEEMTYVDDLGSSIINVGALNTYMSNRKYRHKEMNRKKPC